MAFSVINCTRLLLNIRRAYYFGTDDDEPGFLPWQVIAGGETPGVSRMVTIPRRHRSSQSTLGILQVEVAVEVEVSDEVPRTLTRTSRSSDMCGGDAGYELSEIKSTSG